MRDAAGAAREMVCADEQRDRLAAFDHARHAHPGGERKRAHGRSAGTSDEIERDQAEVAGLEDEVHRLERCQAAGPSSSPHHRRRGPTAARRRSRPSAAADAGSNRSHGSINATASPRSAAAAIAWHRTVVRPAERGPTISERWPRDKPPPSAASIAGTPVCARSSRACRHSAEVVSVTSSFRARSSDSRWARAVMTEAGVSLFIRQRRASISGRRPGIKRQSSHPCKCWKDGC